MARNPLCIDPPRGQCTFYTQCLEDQLHCGPEGYPLGFGKKFCDKFSEAAGLGAPDQNSNFSSRGEEWMLATMQCLQRALVPMAESLQVDSTTSNSAQCRDVNELAFASHHKCYLESGLCTLPPKDWIEIVRVVGVGTLLGSWNAIKQTVEVGWGCLREWSSDTEAGWSMGLDNLL